MKHIGLFEGIGGFSLAARNVGWETIAWCEINEFCQKVLKFHFPESEANSDIKKTDFKKYANKIDIVTGGFPCQPYSNAGKQLGTADDRHLWPEMLRAIREIQPAFVVGENVRGLVNWNGGMVFDQVQADLEAEGYEVTPYLLPACSINAPHRRDRIWFIAYSENFRCKRSKEIERERREYICEGSKIREALNEHGGSEIITNSDSDGCKWIDSENEKHASKRGKYAFYDFEPFFVTNTYYSRKRAPKSYKNRNGEDDRKKWELAQFELNRYGIRWKDFPTQPPICGGDDGISRKLDGITFPKWRNETIKAYGNAVVPALVEQIFKAINENIQR